MVKKRNEFVLVDYESETPIAKVFTFLSKSDFEKVVYKAKEEFYNANYDFDVTLLGFIEKKISETHPTTTIKKIKASKIITL